MKTQPLKGMRDLLPREQALRDYIQGQILATYRAAGADTLTLDTKRLEAEEPDLFAAYKTKPRKGSAATVAYTRKLA